MIGTKEPKELDDYPYLVCEISYCENEYTDAYEYEDRIIEVCDQHYRMLNSHNLELS